MSLAAVWCYSSSDRPFVPRSTRFAAAPRLDMLSSPSSSCSMRPTSTSVVLCPTNARSYAISIAFTPLIVSYTVEILPFSIRAKGFNVFNFVVSLALIFNQYVNPIALQNIAWKYYVCDDSFMWNALLTPNLRTRSSTAAGSSSSSSSAISSSLRRRIGHWRRPQHCSMVKILAHGSLRAEEPMRMRYDTMNMRMYTRSQPYPSALRSPMTAARLQTKRPRPRDVASSSVDYGCAECSYNSDVTILLWMDNLTVYFDSYGNNDDY